MKSKLMVFKQLIVVTSLIALIFCVGCGSNDEISENEHAQEVTTENEQAKELSEESANDGHIDFTSLQGQNEEIFAWLQVPGTNIDCAIVQSNSDSSYYRTHDYLKNEDNCGAAFIEANVLNDMCDFNTVIHGNGTGIFEELINFENPDFFETNRQFHIFLPDNQLSYEVAAVFERDNSSLIRDFSFAEAKGDRDFINYVINERIPGKLLCEGWEEFDEYNFFTTLTVDEPGSDKQLVVVGILVSDAAGTIDREVIEEMDLGPDLLAQ